VNLPLPKRRARVPKHACVRRKFYSEIEIRS
jgi:hypothetical protein